MQEEQFVKPKSDCIILMPIWSKDSMLRHEGTTKISDYELDTTGNQIPQVSLLLFHSHFQIHFQKHYEFWIQPLIAIDQMHRHVCTSMLLLLMLNFNIMKNILFPIFHVHKNS